MVATKINGALRWSAAEEVAVRISAVRSQVATAANSDAEMMGKQLRLGLSEIDSIRQFIHDGINMCNRQYVDGGSRDAVLQGALEKGLSELEEVRSKLVSTLNTSKPSAEAPAAAPPMQASMKRPPSAPTRTAVQREIEAKKAQRAASEQQRKSFLERSGSISGAAPVEPSVAQNSFAATSRPTSATQRPPLQSNIQSKNRPTSATVRGASAQPDSNFTASASSNPQPPPPRNQQTATPPASSNPLNATGLKFRPSSAPNARSNRTDPPPQPQPQMQGQPPTQAADAANAWGKYQDWAQSVLNRVQSRRVMQHRATLQKQRESDKSDGVPSNSSTPSTPPVQPPQTTTPTTPPAAQAPKVAPNLAQSIVQGNLRRPRPSTAGLTPSGGVTATPGQTGPARPQSAKLNPQAQSLREQGNVLFQQKRYKESAEAYSRAIECDPHSETLYCNRAAAFLMLNKYHDALQDSLKAIEFDPTHVKAHWRAAKAYLYLGQTEEARAMYQQSHRLATIPTESDAIEAEMKAVDLTDKCRRCLKTREWQEGLRLSEQVLEVFPTSGPCSMPWQCLKAEAMIFVDPHEACNLLAQMTTDDPGSAEAWYLRAKALFYTGHDGVSTNSCITYLQKSRELDPSNRSATLQLCIETFAKLRDEGNSAYSAGRWQDAHAAYSKCLTVDPYNTSLKAIILCNRAAVSIQCEKWKDALDDINQSIAYNPHNAKAYTRRARIHQHNSQFDLAVKDLQLAVQMYPSAENQERLTQAIEMKNQAARQQQQKQPPPGQPQQGQQQQMPGGSFRYFGFASGGGASFGQQSRPSTAGAKRPQSAGYGGESNNNYGGYTGYSHLQQPQQPKQKSFYEILSITKTSDEKAIVRAYRDAALKWHPDKWASATNEQKQQAENVFKEISVAYNTLKDAAKRRQYDLTV